MKVVKVTIEFDHAKEKDPRYPPGTTSELLWMLGEWSGSRTFFNRDIEMMVAINKAVRERNQ